MRKLLYITLLGLFTACGGGQPEVFVCEVMNSYTPVKQQGSSQLCWAYAMLSTIETEHIMRGDSVHLSVPFIAHHLKSDRLAPPSGRGMAATLVRLIGQYGMVPHQSMPDSETIAPRWAFLYGAEYTPLEFAHSVCAPDEYCSLITTDRWPYGEERVADLSDNWTRERFLNLTPSQLLKYTEMAVRQHHGVCWEGDTGDPGFDWQAGLARLTPLSALSKVSDDHCMAIVGIASDEQHRLYFIMKNSWGTGNVHGGLLYMSFDYFLRNTVSVVLPRSVIDQPAEAPFNLL